MVVCLVFDIPKPVPGKHFSHTTSYINVMFSYFCNYVRNMYYVYDWLCPGWALKYVPRYLRSCRARYRLTTWSSSATAPLPEAESYSSGIPVWIRFCHQHSARQSQLIRLVWNKFLMGLFSIKLLKLFCCSWKTGCLLKVSDKCVQLLTVPASFPLFLYCHYCI